MIIIIHGLPGSGKSYVAKILSDTLNGIYLSSDEIRKRLLNNLNYEVSERELIYRTMSLFIEKLSGNNPVIVDGTFSKNIFRNHFTSLAEKMGDKIYFIRCVCSDSTSIERIANRKDTLSDATANVYYMIKKEWEEYDSAINSLVINTETDITDNIKTILKFIGR